MTEQTEGAEVEALIPWLGDLVTFAVGAYAETMVGAREAGDPSVWAGNIAREFCEARRPIELAAREAAAEARGAARADAVRDEKFGNLRWMDGHQQGLKDGAARVLAAVEAYADSVRRDSTEAWGANAALHAAARAAAGGGS